MIYDVRMPSSRAVLAPDAKEESATLFSVKQRMRLGLNLPYIFLLCDLCCGVNIIFSALFLLMHSFIHFP